MARDIREEFEQMSGQPLQREHSGRRWPNAPRDALKAVGILVVIILGVLGVASTMVRVEEGETVICTWTHPSRLAGKITHLTAPGDYFCWGSFIRFRESEVTDWKSPPGSTFSLTDEEVQRLLDALRDREDLRERAQRSIEGER